MIIKQNIQSLRKQYMLCQQELKNEIQRGFKIAEKAHKALECRGVTRSDFKF